MLHFRGQSYFKLPINCFLRRNIIWTTTYHFCAFSNEERLIVITHWSSPVHFTSYSPTNYFRYLNNLISGRDYRIAINRCPIHQSSRHTNRSAHLIRRFHISLRFRFHHPRARAKRAITYYFFFAITLFTRVKLCLTSHLTSSPWFNVIKVQFRAPFVNRKGRLIICTYQIASTWSVGTAVSWFFKCPICNHVTLNASRCLVFPIRDLVSHFGRDNHFTYSKEAIRS